jgi:murein L,D-transpeptidase YafK
MGAWNRRGFVAGLAAIGAAAPANARADIPRLTRIRTRVMEAIEDLFADRGVAYPPRRVFLRAFKHERQLELWAASHRDDAATLIESHAICAASGVLGPKRRQGDLQVPEGAYVIHRYNAWSKYHLALRVNYPNASDRVRGLRWNLGGAIMVHGECASIGCIAIENRPIERVFIPVLDGGRAGGRQPPIHIFPTRFDDDGAWSRLETADDGNEDLLAFWHELEPIHAAFEETRLVPRVEIEPKSGRYRVVT